MLCDRDLFTADRKRKLRAYANAYVQSAVWEHIPRGHDDRQLLGHRRGDQHWELQLHGYGDNQPAVLNHLSGEHNDKCRPKPVLCGRQLSSSTGDRQLRRDRLCDVQSAVGLILPSGGDDGYVHRHGRRRDCELQLHDYGQRHPAALNQLPRKHREEHGR